MARNLNSGGIRKTLIITAVPTMIGMGAQMFYDLVDIFWLGHMSSAAVAGVTVFSSLFWIFEALNEVIGISSVSLISQAYGSGDRERTNLAIEQTVTFKFVAASIAAVLIALTIRPLMHLFVQGEVADLGLEYGYIRLFFLPIAFSSFSVNTILRCIGDTAGAMKIMLFTSVLNAVLDPLFMFTTIPYVNLPGLGMGVFGAAAATILSQAAAFLLGFYLIFSGRKGVHPSLKRLFRLDRKLSAQFLTIGLPSGLEQLLRSSSSTLALGFVAVFGTGAIAAAGIVTRLLNFIFIPLIGLVIAGSVMAGQAVGAKDVERAGRVSRSASEFGVLVMAALALLSVPFGGAVLSLFSRDPAVLAHAWTFLVFGMAGLIFQGWKTGQNAAFVGAGYNMPLFIGSLVSRWLVQIPFMALTVNVLHLSILWVWIAFVLADFIEMLSSIYYFSRGAWRRIRV